MLPKDRFHLQVEAEKGARLFLGSQSATRIFKSLEPDLAAYPGRLPATHGMDGISRAGRISRQRLIGELFPGALVVHLPDPIMPYADSRFEQSQVWTLHPGARLALGEVVQAGRISRGEVYAFSEYRASWRIENSRGRPLLLDRISLEPGRHGMAVPGCLAMPGPEAGASGLPSVFTQWATFAFCGPGWQGFERHMREALSQLPLWPWGVAGPDEASRALDRKVLAALWRKDDQVLLLRALAVDSQAMNMVLGPLQEGMASRDVLGFSPWARKF